MFSRNEFQVVTQALIFLDDADNSAATPASAHFEEWVSKTHLRHLIDHLRMQGIETFSFTGFPSSELSRWLGNNYPTLSYEVFGQPKGKTSALFDTLQDLPSGLVIIAEARNFLRIDLEAMVRLMKSKQAECVVALKPLSSAGRHRRVDLDEQGKIIGFRNVENAEKTFLDSGMYLLDLSKLRSRKLEGSVDFRKDYLEKCFSDSPFFGSVQDVDFFDPEHPGEPSSLKPAVPSLKDIDSSWTLFLDRDGVINLERVGQYILNWSEFVFNKGVLDIFKRLSDHFGRIIIVSNQKGVGKGLMSEQDLQTIHLEMQREVEIVGGRIDKIYYCTDREDTCFYRKPNPGMAVQARRDFPDIDLSKSIMVGNKPSDMRFGRAAGMLTVFVKTTNPDQTFPHPDIDMVFTDLYEFASAL